MFLVTEYISLMLFQWLWRTSIDKVEFETKVVDFFIHSRCQHSSPDFNINHRVFIDTIQPTVIVFVYLQHFCYIQILKMIDKMLWISSMWNNKGKLCQKIEIHFPIVSCNKKCKWNRREYCLLPRKLFRKVLIEKIYYHKCHGNGYETITKNVLYIRDFIQRLWHKKSIGKCEVEWG